MSEFKTLSGAADMARDLAERCRTWPPGARLLGNIRAEDLADLADWVAAMPEEYFRSGDLGELADRQPNGLTEKRFETAAWFHLCVHGWTKDAGLVQRADEEGMTDINDRGMLAGDLQRLADFIMDIPPADKEHEPSSAVSSGVVPF
jgi:hypothetical protein